MNYCLGKIRRSITKEICKNCEHRKPTYKSYYCDCDKAKKTRLQDTCEKWERKRNGIRAVTR